MKLTTGRELVGRLSHDECFYNSSCVRIRRGLVPCTETSHRAGPENGEDEPSLAIGDLQDVTQGSWAEAGVLHHL